MPAYWNHDCWLHALSYISCWSATLLKWSQTFTIANISKKKLETIWGNLQIIHLTFLSNVMCSVWRSILCFQIIRINLSQMLPLSWIVWATEYLAVPVGNTCTTLCSNLLSTKCLVQFIMLSIAYLKCMGWVFLHSAFWYSMEAGLQHCNTQEVLHCKKNVVYFNHICRLSQSDTISLSEVQGMFLNKVSWNSIQELLWLN